MEYFIVRVHYSEVESATYEGRYESVRKDMLETVPKIEDFLFDMELKVLGVSFSYDADHVFPTAFHA